MPSGPRPLGISTTASDGPLHCIEAMSTPIFNVKEPRGASVIKSASGGGVHVAKPRGEAYLRKVGSGGAIKRAAAARRKAKAA